MPKSEAKRTTAEAWRGSWESIADKILYSMPASLTSPRDKTPSYLSLPLHSPSVRTRTTGRTIQSFTATGCHRSGIWAPSAVGRWATRWPPTISSIVPVDSAIRGPAIGLRSAISVFRTIRIDELLYMFYVHGISYEILVNISIQILVIIIYNI
jgi:hypothetical protein